MRYTILLAAAANAAHMHRRAGNGGNGNNGNAYAYAYGQTRGHQASSTLSPTPASQSEFKTCPAIPSCPADDACIWTDYNGAEFKVSCGVDLYGGDSQTAQATDYGDCMNACVFTDGCIAVSYTSGFCYLKNKVNPPVRNSAVNAAIQIRKGASPPEPSGNHSCGASIVCPYEYGCTYSTRQGSAKKDFIVNCDHDYYGGDLAFVSSTSLDACIDICSLTTGCQAVSYVHGAPEGTCYMKSSITTAIYNSQINAAFLRGA